MQGPARILIVGKDATNDKKLSETLIGRTRNVDLKVAA